MTSTPTWLAVVALDLRDEEGRVLLQKRPAHKAHGGLWEFPGGKVEQGENPRAALCREIAEELRLTVEPRNLQASLVADEADASAGDVPIVLILYSCTVWGGEVVAVEGQQWGWYTLEDAASLPMPPMDTDLLKRMMR